MKTIVVNIFYWPALLLAYVLLPIRLAWDFSEDLLDRFEHWLGV